MIELLWSDAGSAPKKYGSRTVPGSVSPVVCDIDVAALGPHQSVQKQVTSRLFFLLQ
jgi:hypothetical protein